MCVYTCTKAAVHVPSHGLVFGVLAGLTTMAFSFMLSLSSPGCNALVEVLWLLCLDLNV